MKGDFSDQTEPSVTFRSHLSWVVPLGCLRDVVHEVELAGGCLGHLPPGGKLTKHLVLRPPNVVALLPLVMQLQRLVRLKQIHNYFCCLLIQSMYKYIFDRKQKYQITCQWCVRNYV